MKKFKETAMMTAGALVFLTLTGLAKADEKTITPAEFGPAIASVPTKVATHISNEISETKEFQKANWADMKFKWKGFKERFLSN
jgi:hypothetical protein